jgi:hypothetical protein
LTIAERTRLRTRLRSRHRRRGVPLVLTVLTSLAITVLTPSPAHARGWVRISTRADDIGINGRSQHWIWVTDPDNAIWVRLNNTWQRVDGAKGDFISVDPQGNPWVVDLPSGAIKRREGNSWIPVEGAAFDIGIGANGHVWVTGRDEFVYRWNGRDWDWVNAWGKLIDVDGEGNAWVIDPNSKLWRWTGNGWTPLPGIDAFDIGIGPFTWSIFKVGSDRHVYRWNGGGWLDYGLPGPGASSIDVDPRGDPYVVTTDGNVYRWNSI